jgi:hypothetical protein
MVSTVSSQWIHPSQSKSLKSKPSEKAEEIMHAQDSKYLSCPRTKISCRFKFAGIFNFAFLIQRHSPPIPPDSPSPLLAETG